MNPSMAYPAAAIELSPIGVLGVDGTGGYQGQKPCAEDFTG
jgi:hypothetical protein